MIAESWRHMTSSLRAASRILASGAKVCYRLASVQRVERSEAFDIFVSYRKSDARFGAAAVYELLTHRFGKERIFLDNQSMLPGSIYPQRLREALNSVRVLLVLIGPNWLAIDPTSPNRFLIQHENDWVRHEIRNAVARCITIVPVLLDGASLPGADELPEDVRPLVHRQFVEVRHRYLGADIKRLADVIDELLVDTRPPRSATHDNI